jgi:IS1 family transposase
LQNTDFDTGRPVRAGEYKLADETYARLLEKLAKHDFENTSPELRRNLLAFYNDPNAPNATRRDKDDWRATQRALDQLKAMQGQPASARKQ